MALQYQDIVNQQGGIAINPQTGAVTTAPVTSPFASPAQTTQPANPMPTTSDVQQYPTPQLPAMQAPTIMDSYVTSLSQDLANQRKAVEDAYKRELEAVQTKSDELRRQMDELTKKQEGIIETDINQLTQPFRADLENAERDRLFINENFNANQSLVRELEKLLTDSSNMMRQMQGQRVPGLASIQQSPQLMANLGNVAARVGVIEAVMSARSGQIAEGYRMIDRSIDAMNADRRDRLNYYSTVLDFYQNQKDEKGEQLFKLEQKEYQWLQKQVGLLEDDLARSQATADYIKELMVNPDTAKFMADAGITLNDSIQEIQRKMAEQTTRQQRIEQARINKQEAFKAGITNQFYNKGGMIVRTSDGWEFETPEEFQRLTGMTIDDAIARGLVDEFSANTMMEKQMVSALMEKYWDAGIRPTDNLATAEAKAMNSRIYQDQIRRPARSGGGSGSSGSTGVKLNNRTKVESLIKEVISEVGGVNDENRYDLWGLIADEIDAQGYMTAGSVNDLLWKYFHPESAKGYKKYVLGQETKTKKSSDNPFVKKSDNPFD